MPKNKGAAKPDKPEKTDEQKELQQQVQQHAKRMAEERGLDWKSIPQEERKELKRSARQQLKPKSA